MREKKEKKDEEEEVEGGRKKRRREEKEAEEEDEDGNAVTRSFGVPTTHVQYFKYNGNGNPQGTYRVGEFDEDGLPVQAEA